MKGITEQLFSATGGSVKVIPEASQPDGHYHCIDDGGVETEVGEFLYGLVRILQPEHVLTTGIYSGISDMYIAQGLMDNGHGHTDAVEFEAYHINRARELWNKVGLADKITIHHQSSLDYVPRETEFELIVLDTEPGIRFQELVNFYQYLKPGGYIVIHDLPNTLCQGNFNPDHPEIESYPYGPVPQEMMQWLKDDKLRMVHFPSPRGLTIFYKVKEGDFKFQ